MFLFDYGSFVFRCANNLLGVEFMLSLLRWLLCIFCECLDERYIYLLFCLIISIYFEEQKFSLFHQMLWRLLLFACIIETMHMKQENSTIQLNWYNYKFSCTETMWPLNESLISIFDTIFFLGWNFFYFWILYAVIMHMWLNSMSKRQALPKIQVVHTIHLG